MSSSSQLVYYLLWYAHPLLQALVAVVLWRRKLYKQFPAFLIYLVAQIVLFAAAFLVIREGAKHWYFALYCVDTVASALLGFRVIHEVFLDVFRPYHTLKDLGTIVFKWAGVVMLLVSVVVAFSNSFERDPLVHAVTTLERSVRLAQFGLILFLLLFSRFLGVSRKQTSFGIALGFGLFAGVDLMLLALKSGDFLPNAPADLIHMAAYNVAIGAWFAYALFPNAVRHQTLNPLQTQRWEAGLAGLHHGYESSAAPDSLIPMFEGMVERAFSRSSNLAGAEQHDSTTFSDSRRRIPAAAAAAAASKTRA